MGEVIPFQQIPESQKDILEYIFFIADKHKAIFRTFADWLVYNKDYIQNDNDNILYIASVYYMFLRDTEGYAKSNNSLLELKIKAQKAKVDIKGYMDNNIKNQAISDIDSGPLFAVYAEDIAHLQSREYDEQELQRLDELADKTKRIAQQLDKHLSRQI